MSYRHVAVDAVEFETDRGGLTVEIAVRRYPSGAAPYYAEPRATDVPRDIRDGLRAWLDRADNEGGTA